MPNNISRGIRKVNENLLTNGRAILITERDKDQYFWEDIPVGSKMINTTDGTEYVKLEGESDWVPSKIKNDGTLSIAKDSIVKTEIFKIKNLDEGDGHFCYVNSKGEDRHQTFTEEGYMFELEEGSYQMYRNHLDIMLDDCLLRNAATNGIEEITPRRFLLKDKLVVGEEITARYINTIRLGNPYPRIFESKDTPEKDDSEIGDIWVQYDYTLEDADRYTDKDGKIDWTIIKNTPTSLKGYGIEDPVTLIGHSHKVSDITDFPNKIPMCVLADEAKQLKGFDLSLGDELSGTVNINGSSNVTIPAKINRSVLNDVMKDALSDDSLVDSIRAKLPMIKIQSGTLVVSNNSAIPVPNSNSDRNKCHYMISGPIRFSYDPTTEKVINNIVFEVSRDGIINTNATSAKVNYISIDLQNVRPEDSIKYYEE